VNPQICLIFAGSTRTRHRRRARRILQRGCWEMKHAWRLVISMPLVEFPY